MVVHFTLVYFYFIFVPLFNPHTTPPPPPPRHSTSIPDVQMLLSPLKKIDKNKIKQNPTQINQTK